MTPRTKEIATFNSPLEVGIRLLAVLSAAYPQTFDLQRLVFLDYILVHSGDVAGPVSLHPPVPLRTGELLVKRRLVERSLLLLLSRRLIERIVDRGGIQYRADDAAGAYIESLGSQYMQGVKERAEWLASTEFCSLADAEFRSLTRRLFEPWIEQFQSAGHESGGEA